MTLWRARMFGLGPDCAAARSGDRKFWCKTRSAHATGLILKGNHQLKECNEARLFKSCGAWDDGVCHRCVKVTVRPVIVEIVIFCIFNSFCRFMGRRGVCWGVGAGRGSVATVLPQCCPVLPRDFFAKPFRLLANSFACWLFYFRCVRAFGRTRHKTDIINACLILPRGPFIWQPRPIC